MNRSRFAPIILLMGVFFALTTGARAMDYWVTSPLQNVFKDTSAPARRRAEIQLVAARNQTENAQIVWTPEATIKSARVEFEPLVSASGGKIDSANLDYRFMDYIRVDQNCKWAPGQTLRKAPDDFPDGLLDERALEIAPGRNWPVFLFFRVPKETAPGLYRGKLWLVGEGVRTPVEVSLEVVPVTFPDRTRLNITIWPNQWSIASSFNTAQWGDRYFEITRKMAKAMRAHHQNTTLVPVDLISFTKEPDGKIASNYGLFDKWIEAYSSEGVMDRIEIGHVGGRPTGNWDENFAFNVRKATESATKQEVEIQIQDWLPDLQKHLEQKGWLSRAMIHIADEPTDDNAASWIALSKRVHELAPKLKRIDAVHTHKVLDDVEVIVPQIDFYTPELHKKAREKGVELWFYTCVIPQGKYVNRFIDFAAVKTRLLSWTNYRYDIGGYLHWALNWWNVPFLQYAPGDCEIIWPGKDDVRSSIRYEAMRSGVEDHELLSMLADANARVAEKLGAKIDPRARSLELCTRILRTPTDYEISPAKLESVRNQLLHELATVEQSPLLLVQTDVAEGAKADSVTVSGVVEKGAGVRVNGVSVAVDAGGRFSAKTSEKRVVITAEKDGAAKTAVREFK